MLVPLRSPVAGEVQLQAPLLPEDLESLVFSWERGLPTAWETPDVLHRQPHIISLTILWCFAATLVHLGGIP